MANMQYIKPNKLRLRTRRYRTFTVLLGIPALCAASYINPILGALTLLPLYKMWRYQGRWLAGAIGEETALGLPTHAPGCLAELPDEYVIFNQIEISYRGQKRELDLVVLGPNGLFAIEVKHYRGTVQGSDKNRFWTQYLHGQNKTKSARNPVSQVKSAIYHFKRVLKSHNLSPWIEGIVVFTHPNCTLRNDTSSVPVLRLSELTNYILTYKPKNRFTLYTPLLTLLSQHAEIPHAVSFNKMLLPSKKTPKAPNKTRHISYFMRDMTNNKVRDIMEHKTYHFNDLTTQLSRGPIACTQRNKDVSNNKKATKRAKVKKQTVHRYNTNITVNINNPTVNMYYDNRK